MASTLFSCLIVVIVTLCLLALDLRQILVYSLKLYFCLSIKIYIYFNCVCVYVCVRMCICVYVMQVPSEAKRAATEGTVVVKCPV